jgi:hypothetical protein
MKGFLVMEKQNKKRHYGDGSYSHLQNGKYRFSKTFKWRDENGEHTKVVAAQGKTMREALARWNAKTTELKKGTFDIFF